jgi:tRNA (guanine37-N1)-methyltransferase
MFAPVLNESIIKRAQAKGKVGIFIHNLRDFSPDKHRKVDDRPFGGGPGMVMRPEPIFNAVEYIRSKVKSKKSKVILLSPQGRRLNQKICKGLAKYKHLILLCGHYEGIDERVRRTLVDEEISIGDYVLTGGELPAMVVIDCVIRLIPGVLGERKSLHFESFEGNLLEYSQYTRPANYRAMKVPTVLLSGNHRKIEKWRQGQSLKVTKQKRPDLIRDKYSLQ